MEAHASTEQPAIQPSNTDPPDRQQIRREKARRLLHMFGWVQVIEGILACVLGIATIVFSAPTLTFTFLMGTQMWCGIILVSAGFLGVKASKYQDLPDGSINRRERSIVVMHYSWTIIAFIPAILILLYAGIALALCDREADDTSTACIALNNIQTGLGLTNVTLGTILSVTILPFMISLCVFCRSFSNESKDDRATERTEVPPGGTVLEDTVRRQSHIIRQQQEQIHRLSQRQEAMEQVIQASQIPLDAPPPYPQDDLPVVEFQKTPPPYKPPTHVTTHVTICLETV